MSSAWQSAAELGSMTAIRLMSGVYRLLGRRLSSLLLYPIAFYFFLSAPRSRRASLQYLETLHEWSGGVSPPRRPRRIDALRHIHHFALNLFDRMVAWGGNFESFDFEHRGSDILFRVAAAGKGGILLGAHLGSYDMPRLLADRHGVVLNVLMFTRQAERINAFFERLAPDSNVRVLQLEPGSVRTAFEIRACLSRGELVAILADRLPPGTRERTIELDFLGRPTRMALSPFLLACTLGCPLMTSICVRTGASSYDETVELLFDGQRVHRRHRDRRAAELAARFVRILEEQCRRHPYQWFNFYDYWQSPGSKSTTFHH
jgi:predicted LPLAT superfamily acyltransferase